MSFETKFIIAMAIIWPLIGLIYLGLKVYTKTIFKHKHKWQMRATNRYQVSTYQVCLRCGQAQQWTGGPNGDWENCERKKEFDAQFDSKGNLINNVDS